MTMIAQVRIAPRAGGPGPRLESWAFAIDGKGLQVLLARGVFATRTCKLCNDGVVVMGEYGITVALFEKGYSIDTLMAKYGSVDWQDPINWKCNDQVSAHLLRSCSCMCCLPGAAQGAAGMSIAGQRLRRGRYL
jgi:hypothetical protein